MAKPMEPHVSERLLSILQSRSDLIAIELILRTGVRSHELRSIAIFDRHIDVTAAKGSDNHPVPISEEFNVRLMQHWVPFLRKHRNCSHISFKALLREMWADLKKEYLWLSPYSLHSLRGGFALLVYKKTNNPVLVQELLGHRSLQSTMFYIRLARIHENRDKILEAIG